MRKIVLSLALLLAVGIFFACSKSSGGGGGGTGPTNTYSIGFDSGTVTVLTSGVASPVVAYLYIDGVVQSTAVSATSFNVSHSSGVSSASLDTSTIYSGKPFTITASGSGTATLTINFHDATATKTFTLGGGAAPESHTYSIIFDPSTVTSLTSGVNSPFEIYLYVDGVVQPQTVAATSFDLSTSAGIVPVDTSGIVFYSGKSSSIKFDGAGTATLTIHFYDATATKIFTVASSSGSITPPTTHTYSIGTDSGTSTMFPSGVTSPVSVNLYVDGVIQSQTVAADSFNLTYSSGVYAYLNTSTIYSGKPFTITASGTGTATLTINFYDATTTITFNIY